MPIPPAHPFVVLPFRRWCPHWLNFPALVIGSLTPDMANCLNWDHFTHSFVGSFVFCLPFGILLLSLFARTRTSLVAALPSPHRDALLPLCSKWESSVSVCILSLLLGTWTHLCWDLVTHNHSAVAQSLGYWMVPLPNEQKQLRVSTVLGILSGFIGPVGLATVYWRWLRAQRISIASSLSQWRQASVRWLPWVATPFLVSIPLGMYVTKNQGGVFWVIRAIVEFYLPLQCFSLATAGFAFRSKAAEKQ